MDAEHYNNQFLKLLKNNDLLTAQKVHSIFGPTLTRTQLNSIFKFSCEKGHIEVAKWLHLLGADIHDDSEYAFRLSCKNGHIEIAKWLHQLGADIHACNDYALKNSSKEVFTWLNEFNPKKEDDHPLQSELTKESDNDLKKQNDDLKKEIDRLKNQLKQIKLILGSD